MMSKEIELPEATEIREEKIDPSRNDVSYADSFISRHGERIRFVTDENLWLLFEPLGGWRRDSSGTAIRALATDYARTLYAEALEAAKGQDAQAGIALVRKAATRGNRARIEAMLALAQCDPHVAISSSKLDRDTFIVGVQNGTVDLRSGDFLPHDPTRLVTRQLATIFDPAATAPSFLRFLEDVQPDLAMRGFLQRWAGYCLTAEIREHTLPFHFGSGSNGKSIFLEHCLLRLSGSYGAKLSDSLIYCNDRGTQPYLEIASLCGKRLAVGEENAAGAGLNENFLKSATGGDTQKGRYHYANFFEYRPSAKLALVGNHRPRVEGRDHGFWRRFLLVDWPVQIPNEKQDTALPEKLKAEMPGILNWCIEGAQEWLLVGLKPPNSCLTDRFRIESDSLAGFLERFEAHPGGWVTKARVFELYQTWAQEEGIPSGRQLTKRSLMFRLVERGFREERVGNKRLKSFVDVKEVEGNDD